MADAEGRIFPRWAKGYLSWRRSRFILVALLLCAMASLLSALSIAFGSTFIDIALAFKALLYPASVEGPVKAVVHAIRLPRTLAAISAGAALALSGLLTQASTGNPLAEPYLMGIASGAVLAVSLAFLLGVGGQGPILLNAVAFLGALSASSLSLGLSYAVGGGPLGLVLSGVAVSFFLQSLATLVQFATPEGSSKVLFWLLGSLSMASWERLGYTSLAAVMAFLLALALAKGLNALLLGDDHALSLGYRPVGLRILCLMVSCFSTSLVVTWFGIIGFIGLVAPHMVRIWMRTSDHFYVVPLTSLAGANLMLLGDLAARAILRPGELPIGPIMALIGSPLFIRMLLKSKGVGFG